MSITSRPPVHPLLAAAHTVAETLDDVADIDPLYLSVSQKQTLLVGLTAAITRLTGLRADVLAVAEDVASESGARSAGAWLTARTRTSRQQAASDQRLGEVLRERWPTVRRAVRTGAVTWEQAGILTRSLNSLPDGLDPDLLAKAEAHLVHKAGEFGPRQLRRLGRKVLEVIAPEVAEGHEHRALLAQEEHARAETRLSFHPRGDGTVDLHLRLPEPVGNRLRTYLDAYTSPRRIALDSDVDQLSLRRRRGEAFCALLEHLPATGLPRQGGTATQVLVMIDYDTLRHELAGSGLAETSTGDLVTAGEARRLACTAGIIPVVLGSKSEILDQGRSSRLFKGPLRIALDLRDRHCRAEGCDIPAAWCEAHHNRTPWIKGGRTTLDDGILLCPHHHHRAHDPAYTLTRLPNGDHRYHRRT
jgi:hypothetical protein